MRCFLGGRTLLLRFSGAFAVQKVANTCPIGPRCRLAGRVDLIFTQLAALYSNSLSSKDLHSNSLSSKDLHSNSLSSKDLHIHCKDRNAGREIVAVCDSHTVRAAH